MRKENMSCKEEKIKEKIAETEAEKRGIGGGGRKIAIVGAGFVGMAYAFALLNQNLTDELVLIDIDRDRAEGEAADLAHGLAFSSSSMKIVAGDYGDTDDADIMVIAAGAAQANGESRSDPEIIRRNSRTVRAITERAVEAGFHGIFLVATNPVDVMSMIVHKVSGFPAARVIGSGTTLDTARLRYLLGKYFGVDPRNIHSYVIGEHGDSEFVPWSVSYVGCKPMDALVSEHPNRFKRDALGKLEEEVRRSAYKIIAAKQSTSYGIGMSLARITRAILEDERSILTVSSLLEGEYGINGVWLGTPCLVDRGGVAGKLCLPLTESELERLRVSGATVNSGYLSASSV